MHASALPALCILFLPLASAAASSLLVFSPASGWTPAPAPAPALTSHTLAHLPSATIAVLNLERARVVVRRVGAVGDAAAFNIAAAACGASGDDLAECTEPVTAHELSAPSGSAASDLEPLLLAVASGASPYGCSHVAHPAHLPPHQQPSPRLRS